MPARDAEARGLREGAHEWIPRRRNFALMEPTQKNRIEVSCDTATRLAIAVAWLDSYASDTELLIVGPTAEAADDLHLQAARSRAARFGIRRFTPNALAAHLARPVLADFGRASASA